MLVDWVRLCFHSHGALSLLPFFFLRTLLDLLPYAVFFLSFFKCFVVSAARHV